MNALLIRQRVQSRAPRRVVLGASVRLTWHLPLGELRRPRSRLCLRWCPLGPLQRPSLRAGRRHQRLRQHSITPPRNSSLIPQRAYRPRISAVIGIASTPTNTFPHVHHTPKHSAPSTPTTSSTSGEPKSPPTAAAASRTVYSDAFEAQLTEQTASPNRLQHPKTRIVPRGSSLLAETRTRNMCVCLRI